MNPSEQLPVHHSKFRIALEAGQLGCWAFDLKGGMSECSSLHGRIFGYKNPPPHWDYAAFLKHVLPEDRARVDAAYRKAVQSGSTWQFECRIRRASDGAIRWIESHGGSDPEGSSGSMVERMMGIVEDITERKLAEQALQWRGEQFRTLVDRAPIGVYLVDSELRLIEVNPVAAPVFGHLKNLVGRALDDVLPNIWEQEVADEVLALFRHTLATGESYHMPERAEYRVDTRMMEYYEWHIDRIPLPDGSHGVVCYFRDISERVRSRAAMAMSEERYRTLFNSIDEGFCIMELIFNAQGKPVDYRYLETNPIFERQSGMKDALGKTISELVPDIEPFWIETYGKVARTGEATRFVDHAMSMNRWFDVYAFRVGDPCENKVAVLFSDISERKETEESLRESEARQAFLVQLADALRPLADPIRIHSETARIIGERFGASRVLYAEVEADGNTIHVHANYCAAGIACLVGEHELDDFCARGAAGLLAGRTLAVADIDAADYAPETRQAFAAVAVAAFVIIPLVKAGRLVAFLTLQQSTPRRWTRQEVALLEDVAERTWATVGRARAEAALRAANIELTHADRQKDEFLAMLAHELRNPLAAIANVVRLLNLTLGSDENHHSSLEILARQTGVLGTLVDDLLDVSRITRGLIDLRHDCVDLAGIVSSALESVHLLAEEKHQELSLALPGKPVPVQGDSVRLEQIIVNLLTNAIKYTDEGGRITLTLVRKDARAELVVGDTGIGLAPHMLSHVFDLFAQAERGLDRAEGGLGIGLTVVKRLVELHGGTIEARSEGLGKGAEFIVCLPLAAAEPAMEANPPVIDTVSSTRILVVDDSLDVAESMGGLLRFMGHEVAVARDGETALARVREFAPEVILLDIGMPGMDGYELARRLREQQGTSKVLLAALTGYDKPRDRELTAGAGFDAHFVKPVDIAALKNFLASKVSE